MKKTIFKVVGIILMISALIFTQIPALGTNASSNADNGFKMDGSKLVKYTGTANAVSVPNGVKKIGAEAFAQNYNLTSITLPSGIDEIESGAFSGCGQLRAVYIPEGCKIIGNGAFADCDKLTQVSLPASLIELGTSVFAGCSNLTSVQIEKGNNSFICDDGVLYNAKKSCIYQVLAGRNNSIYFMPSSVEEIKKYAFWGCYQLQGVNLSSNLREISDYAFSNCSSLESIVLPYSIRAIRQKAFEDCRNLYDITIPISVTQIDPTAFDGCYNMNIQAEVGSTADNFKNELEQKRALSSEYEDAATNNSTNSHWKSDDESDTTSSNVHLIPYASNVEHYVEWDVDSSGVLGRSKVVSGQAVVLIKSQDGNVYGGTNESSISDNQLTSIDKAIAVNNAIGYKAYYCDNSISQILIPDTVNNIGDFAFSRSALERIEIPYGVSSIGYAAFYHCDNLSNVSIPSSVNEIKANAFSNTLWIEDWKNGGDVDDFLIVGDGILLAYKGTQSHVSVPKSVRRIGPGVFENHSEITQVNIPDSVSIIDENAFYNCSSLSTITGMKQVKAIKDRAFYKCPITTVRIPASVSEIGISAYGGTGMTNSVIFLGTKLPEVSYEESSLRLTAERNDIFDGIQTAVIDSSLSKSSLDNTVLDSNVSGFKGVIYQLSSGSDNRRATPIISNNPKESTVLPASIMVYDKNYTVESNTQMSFSKMPSSVSDNSINGLLVVDCDKLKKKDVSISSSGASYLFDGYHFYLSNPGMGTSDLTNAIRDYYGNPDNSNSYFFDLSLYDQTDKIPIHQLGKNTLSVTMPVPSELIGKDICAVTLDQNNNPEVRFCTLSMKDNRQYVSFDISHFSPYALFAPEGELKDRIVQKQSNASGIEGLDDTPNTGDYINIKLVLSIGLLALGAFFTILGFGKRKLM